MKIKKIGILTSGGDCGGLNAVVRAVTHRAIVKYDWEVYGIKEGTSGLMYRPLQYEKLSLKHFSGNLIRQGGTFLGTTNKGNPFKYRMPNGSFKDSSNDFYKLNTEYNCILQMGGSDQWGNIICGIDLSRRLAGKELFGLTTPLLTTSSGQKMGKTEEGAIWLNFISEKDNHSTHPRDFWNYWRDKTENDDVGKFLRLFTNMPLNEIYEIEKLKNEDIEKGKELLATKITELVHGKDSDWKSKKKIVFKKKEFEKGYGLLSLLSHNDLGLAKSNSEARRFIQSKAVKLNGELISDEKYTLTINNFKSSKEIEISLGKKKKIIIEIN